MKKEYHIRQASDIDQELVEGIFTTASSRFDLIDTKVSSLLKGTICNYSEGLGWGFGLGALRRGDFICVGFNSGKSANTSCPPVFDYIANELKRSFGDRVILVSESEQVDLQKWPREPISDQHREFMTNLLNHPKGY